MSSLEFVQVSEPEHIAELANFAEGIFREYFSTFLPKGKVDFLVDYLLSIGTLIREIADENYEYYFADADGEHLGFVGIQPREGYLYLSKFYLARKARGKGHGREEFEFVKKRAAELGYDTIRLNCARQNFPALDRYDHMGFTVLEEVNKEVAPGIEMNDYLLEYKF